MVLLPGPGPRLICPAVDTLAAPDTLITGADFKKRPPRCQTPGSSDGFSVSV